MKQMLLILSALLLTVQANAYPHTETRNVTGLDREESNLNLATVQEQVTLVQSQKGDSFLRVSFVVTDSGGSTDVSPQAKLYLSTFNESEMQDAGSLHLVDHINDLVSTRRVAAGVYEAVVTMYNFNDACSSWGNDFEGKMKITVDARDLTYKVRRFGFDTRDFVYTHVTDPVTVSYECM